MSEARTQADLKKWFRQSLPWGAVFLGISAVFSFAFLNEFPRIIRQITGEHLLLFGLQEAVFRIAVSVLAGRVIVLVLREPIFSVARVLLLQIPLQFLKLFKGNLKKRSFRIASIVRRFIDTIYAISIRRPSEVSLILAAIIYLYSVEQSWRMVGAMVIALLIVLLSPEYVKTNAIQGLRLRFRYPLALKELSELRSLALSTTLLTLAFIAGKSEARLLRENSELALINEKMVAIVFVANERIVGTIADDADGVKWLILPLPNEGIEF